MKKTLGIRIICFFLCMISIITTMPSYARNALAEGFTDDSEGITDSIEVFITVAAYWDNDTICFNIDTNLPDEATLILTLSSGDYSKGTGYTAQSKVTVINNHCTSSGFSKRGEKLSGDYDLEISMSLPSFQTEAVQAMIGKHGEKMTGPLVKKDTITNNNYIKALYTLKVKKEIQVTSLNVSQPISPINSNTTITESNSDLTDDRCVSEVFLKYANSLGKASYKEIKEYLDSLDYAYDTTIGSDELATFNIYCELGKLYICCYPLGYNESDFGKPEKEMLSCLEYERDDRWISISDSMHINGGVLNTGDRARNPVNKAVSSLEELVDYYNNTIGGLVSLETGASVFTDTDRKNQVESTIKTRIKQYTNTTIQRIEVNSNAGTEKADDFIVLIYLNWGTKNSVENTKKMLEMFSDDMAATLAAEYKNASEIVLFWEVPYLLEKGVCAKYTYNARNNKAYPLELVWNI